MDSRIFLIFGAGLIGGCIALFIGVPMPFMLGGLLGAASFVLFYENSRPKLPKLSNTFRQVFMALIGAIIGTRFSPELLKILPERAIRWGLDVLGRIQSPRQVCRHLVHDLRGRRVPAGGAGTARKAPGPGPS